MATHTFKILRCHIAKFLKYIWSFFNIMHERVKRFLSDKSKDTEKRGPASSLSKEHCVKEISLLLLEFLIL